MSMEKVTYGQLSKSVQAFLGRIGEGNGILVEDESGRARFGIIPFDEATLQERSRAMADLESLQKRVGDRMRSSGRQESELDEILQDDD